MKYKTITRWIINILHRKDVTFYSLHISLGIFWNQYCQTMNRSDFRFKKEQISQLKWQYILLNWCIISIDNNQIKESQRSCVSFSKYKNILYYMIKELVRQKNIENQTNITTNLFKDNFNFFIINCNNNSGIACLNYIHNSISIQEILTNWIGMFN